jgi:hypothetical protein
MMSEVFPMIPATARAAWFFGVIALLLIAMVGLFGYIAYSSRHVRFEISPEGLKIAGDLYGRTIPIGALNTGQAEAIDLSRSAEYAPRSRINGTGLPGYAAGWFKLKNGEKALVFLTDPRNVVRIPATEGYSILLSVREADRFVRTLREVAGDVLGTAAGGPRPADHTGGE